MTAKKKRVHNSEPTGTGIWTGTGPEPGTITELLLSCFRYLFVATSLGLLFGGGFFIFLLQIAYEKWNKVCLVRYMRCFNNYSPHYLHQYSMFIFRIYSKKSTPFQELHCTAYCSWLITMPRNILKYLALEIPYTKIPCHLILSKPRNMNPPSFSVVNALHGIPCFFPRQIQDR